MQYWLLKTEPDTFSWDDLCARGDAGEPWDGVRNHQAAGFMRQMKLRDRVYIYHSGSARCVVGSARVQRTSYVDPTDDTGRFVAVDVTADKALARPVSLARMKADAAFAECLLVRQSRLSVMPISGVQWRLIAHMSRSAAED